MFPDLAEHLTAFCRIHDTHRGIAKLSECLYPKRHKGLFKIYKIASYIVGFGTMMHLHVGFIYISGSIMNILCISWFYQPVREIHPLIYGMNKGIPVILHTNKQNFRIYIRKP